MKKYIILFLSLLLFSCEPVSNRTATPVFNPPAGTYSSAQTITISTTTAGATIKYTSGSSDDVFPPTSSNSNGIVYNTPLEINKTTTIKTVCFKEGLMESVATAKYIITYCDCQNYLFCYDFERGDLYGYCPNSYWGTDDPNNIHYSERLALVNGGRNGSYGFKLTGLSDAYYRGRQGVFHHLNSLAPTYIGFYVGTMSNNGDTGYFDLSQSIGGTKHEAIVFHFGSDGQIHVNDETYGTFNISSWYFIEFKNIEWTNQAGASAERPIFDFYVNGSLVASDLSFKDTNITGFDFLMLYNLDHTEVWYDDIIML